MLAVPGRRRSQRHAVIGVAIYAVFLVTAPFEHHDLLCHLKTPTHCTACTSSVVGNGPNTPVVIDGSALHDAGNALAIVAPASDFLLAAQSTGRSPPVAR
jgi:hypothetical protein